MLDHDEERRLAEIEDRLRLDDPEWSSLFEQAAADAPDVESQRDGARNEPPHPVVGSVLALIVAVLATILATLVFGPNLGGLVAVLSLCAAGMYSYQVLRGCPWLRHGSDEGDESDGGSRG